MQLSALRIAGARIALSSPSFTEMRMGGAAYVDKTSSIADLLNSCAHGDAHRVFFTRPRKFGKSLTLSIAGEMLSSGALPSGVHPWPGYEQVDVKRMFNGLQVYERLMKKDTSLGTLLQRAHFVIKLGLGGAQSGVELKGTIKDGIAAVASRAFGEALGVKVRQMTTPCDALGTLVDAVPSSVPIALLVDEYDAAVIQDVSEGKWTSAKSGIKALRSLAMSTKSPHFGSRIERCIITGVARFAHTTLFSGANNFVDLTGDPLLSRVMGFTEEEVCATYPKELRNLADSLGTDIDGAISLLTRWYNGYCFDGTSSCLNPFPVLVALRAGRITHREMEASSGVNWLGLTPRDLIHNFVAELQMSKRLNTAVSFDIADLERKRVQAVPLLLQAGLLSLIPGQQQLFRPPNEYARSSLQTMLLSSLTDEDNFQSCALAFSSLWDALNQQSPTGFTDAAIQLLKRVPSSMFKASKTRKGEVRESGYHALLAGALIAGAPHGIIVELEAATISGRADIVVRFKGDKAWVIEMGVGSDNLRMEQAQAYGSDQTEREVLCCSLMITTTGSGSTGGTMNAIVHWSKRNKKGTVVSWSALDAYASVR